MEPTAAPVTSPRPPGDPLAELAPRQLDRLARRAARARARRGPGALDRLADRHDVAARRLRLLADAWLEGGRSGVAALGPAHQAEELDEGIHEELARWQQRHLPFELLRWESWRNRVTLWQVQPGRQRLGVPEDRPVCQLRITPDGRWHLYRKAARGEWWPVPVVARRRRLDLAMCLEAVRADVTGAFWSPLGRPYEGGERRGPHRL